MLWHSLTSSVAGTLLLWPLVNAAVIRSANGTSSCKVIPGDPQWPSLNTWNQLNQTVGGRLIASVPEAAVCHPGGYGPLKEDKAACDALQAQWSLPAVFLNTSSDMMSPYFQNGTCNAYYNLDQTCELGDYVTYAISVSGPEDAAAGIKFAKEHNVRLVIRNTGHDFTGKSTGKGALSLWTHNLKDSEIITNYKGNNNYTGSAIKLGAGWTGGETELLVASAGYRIVSGDCPTVGITGGYSQGGGHSLLNSVYGMAADNVLEWEVVTADGRYLTATPTQNQDLYWALAGGGGGTYAVVLSMTTKIYPDGGPIGAATLTFNATSAPNNASYTAAIVAWWQFLPTIIDSGATTLFTINGGTFELQNVTATDKTGDQVATILEPYRAQLRNLSIKFNFDSYTSTNYFQHYNDTNGPLPNGVYPTSELFNSRLIPRGIATSAGRAKNLTDAMQQGIASDPAAGFFFGCSAQNTKNIAHPDNAVVPYWRDAIAICINIAIYDWSISASEMLARREHMANVITPLIEAATPDSGAYLNEADPLVYPPNAPEKWQNAFYGTNYPRLRQIKDKWDTDSIFHGNTAVGSEDWTQDSEGRLCKA